MTDRASLPCHNCGMPRGVSHIDPERYPGKLLCASCAGVMVFRDALKVIREKADQIENLPTATLMGVRMLIDSLLTSPYADCSVKISELAHAADLRDAMRQPR